MIALPIMRDMTRCLGHGIKHGEFCERVNDCARNATIKHDLPGQYSTDNRACTSELMAAHVPLAGFPKDDAA